jgi:hypothetical protein
MKRVKVGKSQFVRGLWPKVDVEKEFQTGGEPSDDSVTLLMHGFIKDIVAEKRAELLYPLCAYVGLEVEATHNVHLYDPTNAFGNASLTQQDHDWLESLPWQDWFTLSNMSGRRVGAPSGLELFNITYAENMGCTPLDIYFYVDAYLTELRPD